jgi:FdhD protein
MNASVQLSIIKINGNCIKVDIDDLAVEEPLEIRMEYGPGLSAQIKNLAVTMRTPGHDEDLAVGFMFTEGIIAGYAAIKNAGHILEACSENKQNVIQVSLHSEIIPNLLQADRNFYTTSSCGVCGKASIGAIHTIIPYTQETEANLVFPAEIIYSLQEKLSGHQKVFAETGGLHAAAIFDQEGELIMVREDVGRHNALDKVIGASLRNDKIPLSNAILLLSGRASFELVQKAAMAGIPVIAAVGAPSSLAVSLATEFGITLVGFLRNNRFNIYSSANRIKIQPYENSN